MKRLLCFQIVLFFIFWGELGAVPGSAKLARETSEYIVKKWGRETVGEGVEATVARLIRQHGEEIAPLLRQHGPQMIRITDDFGAEALPLIRRYGSDGLEVLARSGDQVMGQVARHGDEAMEIAIRHRGIGEELVAELGGEGIRLGKQLSTEEVVQTLRLLPALRREGGVSAFVSAVEQHGSAVFRYIGRHPEIAAGGALLVALLANPEIVIDGVEAVGTGVGRGLRAAGDEMIGGGSVWTRWIWVGIIFGFLAFVIAGPRCLRAWLESRIRSSGKEINGV